MTTLITFIQRAIMQGIPLLYGSTGEILTEKSGNLNLGIPGIMYVGGISGVIGAFLYEESMGANDLNPFLAVLIPLLCTINRSYLLLLNGNSSCKPKCYRSCNYDFRCRFR